MLKKRKSFKELNNYLDDIKFKLKDFEKTNNRWKNYKQEKYNKLLRYNMTNYKQLISQPALLWNRVFQYFPENYYVLYNNLIGRLRENFCKSNIRSHQFFINNAVRDFNNNWLKKIAPGRLNKNESYGFTIKLYLDNYLLLNTAMRAILKDIILYNYNVIYQCRAYKINEAGQALLFD